jgi:hypothetical protein
MELDNSLQQALDLSDRILTAIELQDLEVVTTLDEQRRSIIEVYYKKTVPIDADLTRQLKQKNDLIVSKLVDMQQKTRSQQIKLNQSQKVSKAYLSNT